MGTQAWAIKPVAVTSEAAGRLFREYYVEIADRYRMLRHGRRSTPEEIENELAEVSGDDFAPPSGLLLLGRYRGEHAGCAGVRLLDAQTAELKRVFIRPRFRGTGGGVRLLSAVDDSARDLGAQRIVLDTRLDLIEARTLYQRHGYIEIPAYNESPYAEAWYAKQLA